MDEVPVNMDEQVKRFEAVRSNYETLVQKNVTLISSLLGGAGLHALIESRVKTVAGFAEKCVRGGKTYRDPLSEITDLAGIRIVLSNLLEVKEAEEIIRRDFFVDAERSVNKRLTIKPNEFGYLSTHLIVKTHNRRQDLPEWSNVKDLWAEIQLRTALEHAWAVASHEVDYKGDVGIPSELRRTLIQISGMLENVDTQLSGLITQAHNMRASYKSQIAEDHFDMEMNVDSFLAYLDSETPEYWAELVRDFGVNVEPPDSSPNSLALRAAQRTGIHTIRQLEQILRESKGWGGTVLKEFYTSLAKQMAHRVAGVESTPQRITTSIGGIIYYLLIANFPDVLTPEILMIDFGNGVADLAVNIAMQHNPRMSVRT